MKKFLTIEQLNERRNKGMLHKDVHIVVTDSFYGKDLDENDEVIAIVSEKELKLFDKTINFNYTSVSGFYVVGRTQELADDNEEHSLEEFQKFLIDLELKKEVLK